MLLLLGSCLLERRRLFAVGGLGGGVLVDGGKEMQETTLEGGAVFGAVGCKRVGRVGEGDEGESFGRFGLLIERDVYLLRRDNVQQVESDVSKQDSNLEERNTDSNESNVDRRLATDQNTNTFYYLDSSRLSAPHVALLSLY